MTELTKMQKEFIGTKFETPNGGVLKVKDFLCRIARSNIFILDCSVCSTDKELWPYGEITSNKGNLLKGQIPCGCAKVVQWTERQSKILVTRICGELGYKFHGWTGEYKGLHKTYIKLENTSTGNFWETCNINNFFQGRKDPVAALESKRILKPLPDQYHVTDFISAGFTPQHTFWRSNRKNKKGDKVYWKYTCPVCSEDEYVKVGLCSGVFEGLISDLKRGQRSCRCGNYYWTQGQREYQIKKSCVEEDLIFTDWVDSGGYKNPFSKFNWLCSEGHFCSTSVECFVNRRNRCRLCCNSAGYNPSKMGRLYLVLWYNKDHSYLKKGITNRETIERVKQQYSRGKLDYKIIREVSGDGRIIQEAEKYLNDTMEGYACPKEWLPDGYTETEHNTPENYKFLMYYFDELEERLKEA